MACVAVLASATASCAEGFWGGEHPLIALAGKVPLTAAGTEVVFADLEAGRVEAAAMFRGEDAQTQRFALMTLARPPWPFDATPLSYMDLPDDFIALAGFDFDGIAQIAGWGLPTEGELLLTGDGIANPGRIGAAMEARGYVARDLGGVPVWHRLKDGEIDSTLRRELDPFAGTMGAAVRLAVRDDELLMSRTWAGLEGMLAGTRRLTDDPEIAAVLEAVTQAEAGSLTMLILPSELPRAEGLAESILGPRAAPEAVAALKERLSAGARLPPYRRWAIAGYQDGVRAGGALAFVYDSAEDAAVALEAIGANAVSMTDLLVDRTYADLFEAPLEAGTVEAGGRHVAVVRFTWDQQERVRQAGRDELRPIDLMRSPFSLLQSMYAKRGLMPLVAMR